MAGKKPKYNPGDVVWFEDRYDESRKAVVVTRPFNYDGVEQVELVVPERNSSGKVTKVHVVVPVSELSDPVPDIVLIPNKMDTIKSKVKEFTAKMKIKPGAIIAGVVVFIVLALIGWIVANFNSLVVMNEDVDNSWAKVETQYQNRFDKIGNLVESVKGSQFQEQEVFKAIANARSQYQSAQASGNENAQAQAASSVETNLALIPRLQEAYPELKSNQNVQNLMAEITGTEGNIASARDKYNDTVTNYNKGIGQIPKVIFANWFGYKERAQFKSDAAAAKAVDVNFDDVRSTSPTPTPKAAN